ncbi:MAG: M13 family metallopeptidase [Chitinophagales bacterium]|nr:M13 family metallopeptidase [Chitinophagales bacterium]
MKHSRTALLLLLPLLMWNCESTPPNVDEEVSTIKGLDLSLLDTTINPREDFYQFANGGWLQQTQLPDDRGKWGAFNELGKATDENVIAVLKEAIASGNIDTDTDAGKAVVFYQVAMDTVYLNKLGIQPIQGELDKIAAVQSLEDLQNYLINAASISSNAFFSLGVNPSLNNSEINAAFIGTGKLGLPGKEYYTQDDEETLRLQGEYKDYITRVLQLTGKEEGAARAEASTIFALEQQLAVPKMNKVQKRNPILSNNPRSQDDIAAMTPAFDWKAYFSEIGLASIDTFIVAEPKYIKSLEGIFTNTSLDDLKAYTSWTFLNSALPYLSSEFEKAQFDFYDGVLGGVQVMKPRSETVIQTLNYTIGEALGKLYVDTYFPPAAKEVAEELVANLKKGFSQRINKLEWMSDSTKIKAQEKLTTLRVKIGYPDEWKDYSDLSIKSAEEGGSYVGNMLNISQWIWKQDIEKVGQAVDKGEWFLPPQVVNAYYHPLYNEVVFPAAILQPPYYNYQADPAVNYGGIGAVIGHEISHGFDDQGSRYDAKGNLSNWWTEDDRTRFEARTQKLINQYNKYEPLPGVFVNGAFTLGENIGDLGGLNVAFDGLQKQLEEHGNPGKIDGFTQEQRFFINWATVWRTKFTDEAMQKQIKTNVHSPGMYRAIGPIVSMPAFYEAFNINEGDGMYVVDSLRVEIW